MSHLVTHLGSMLAAAEPSEALKAVEFDLPESTLGWSLLIAGPVLLVAWLIVFNIFDTRTLWRHSRAYLLATGWISLLRLCVVAGIVIIASVTPVLMVIRREVREQPEPALTVAGR